MLVGQAAPPNLVPKSNRWDYVYVSLSQSQRRARAGKAVLLSPTPTPTPKHLLSITANGNRLTQQDTPTTDNGPTLFYSTLLFLLLLLLSAFIQS